MNDTDGLLESLGKDSLKPSCLSEKQMLHHHRMQLVIYHRALEKIESKINLPSNKKLIVSIKTDRRTNYNLYIQALDQIVAAYAEVQNKYAQQVYS